MDVIQMVIGIILLFAVGYNVVVDQTTIYENKTGGVGAVVKVLPLFIAVGGLVLIARGTGLF